MPGHAEIAIRVQPRASADGIAGERDGRLLVRVTAPPLDDAELRARLSPCGA